jgi:hypothetical protein
LGEPTVATVDGDQRHNERDRCGESRDRNAASIARVVVKAKYIFTFDIRCALSTIVDELAAELVEDRTRRDALGLGLRDRIQSPKFSDPSHSPTPPLERNAV